MSSSNKNFASLTLEDTNPSNCAMSVEMDVIFVDFFLRKKCTAIIHPLTIIQ